MLPHEATVVSKTEEPCASYDGWWHGGWQEYCPQRHSQRVRNFVPESLTIGKTLRAFRTKFVDSELLNYAGPSGWKQKQTQ